MKETQEKCKRKIESLQHAKEAGITLIALVVTIVVLLILAGITINMLFSNGGIFKTAGDAANAWNEATVNEQESLNNIADQIANLVNGQVGGGDDTPEDPNKGPNGKPLVDTITEIQTGENIQAEDKYGNPVVVPKGFRVVVDETTKNATTVPEGIVIEDGAGNQFVWIPTGTYKVDESGTTKTNDLTRRQWGTTVNVEQVPTPITGDEVATGYDAGQSYYGERATQDKEGNAITPVSTKIEEFLNSAKPVSEEGHGGFYIGRYEQGEGNVCKAGVNVYVEVTRDTAKAQAEMMYTDKEQYGVTSELISSYAWDTALNFICQNSEHGYTLATTTNNTYGNLRTDSKELTGANGADNYSNIHEFLGNCSEWTTEYSSYTSGSGAASVCVSRGGDYVSITPNNAASRNTSRTDTSIIYISFRLSLYV